MSLSASRIIQRFQGNAQRARADARQIAMEMCSRAPKNDIEAASLLDFNARMVGADPDWDLRFSRIMADYVLTRNAADGALTQANLDWLSGRAIPRGIFQHRNLLGLWTRLLAKATIVPPGFAYTLCESVCTHMVREGGARADAVKWLRQVLALRTTEAEPWVSREEAMLLMRTAEELSTCDNDASWSDLYARAFGNYLVVQAHPNPANEPNSLSRKFWLNPEEPHPGKYVGCIAAGLDKGQWFARMSKRPEAARKAREVAGQAADKLAAKSDKSSLWSRISSGPQSSSAAEALVDFLNREAPGLMEGLVIAAR